MYAIIKLGGHQYKISEGQVIATEQTGHKSNEEFSVEDILLVGDASDDAKEPEVHLGAPRVSDASVKLRVVQLFRSKKIRGFKYKKRKGYRRQWGHRQNLQKLEVLSIQAPQK